MDLKVFVIGEVSESVMLFSQNAVAAVMQDPFKRKTAPNSS